MEEAEDTKGMEDYSNLYSTLKPKSEKTRPKDNHLVGIVPIHGP